METKPLNSAVRMLLVGFGANLVDPAVTERSAARQLPDNLEGGPSDAIRYDPIRY